MPATMLISSRTTIPAVLEKAGLATMRLSRMPERLSLLEQRIKRMPLKEVKVRSSVHCYVLDAQDRIMSTMPKQQRKSTLRDSKITYGLNLASLRFVHLLMELTVGKDRTRETEAVYRSYSRTQHSVSCAGSGGYKYKFLFYLSITSCE